MTCIRYVIRLNIVDPSASQRAAQTESSIKLDPVLFNLPRGIGAPRRVQPILQVKRKTAHASIEIC